MHRLARSNQFFNHRFFSKVTFARKNTVKQQPIARQILRDTLSSKEVLFYPNASSPLLKKTKDLHPKDADQTKISQDVQYNRLFDFLWRKIIVHLLPKGYPESVHAKYLTYVKWQTLQYISGSMSGGMNVYSSNV
jgi:hypothetical protein